MAKPQLLYTLAILETYQETKTGLINAQRRPPKIVYNDLGKMLQESMLLGSTNFGINYIF